MYLACPTTVLNPDTVIAKAAELDKPWSTMKGSRHSKVKETDTWGASRAMADLAHEVYVI